MNQTFAFLFITGLLLVASWCDIKQRVKSIMGKFRSKVVEIEAMQFDGTNATKIHEWVCNRIPLGAECPIVEPIAPNLVIKTLEGNMLVSKGDFVIRGLAGEFYPCKPEIFAKKYEAIS